MAITFTQQPNILNFANNPIIAKVRTTQTTNGTEKSFLRIVCEVTFNDISFSSIPDFKTELSQPVADMGEASFNFSDASQTILNRMMAELDMNGNALSKSFAVNMSATFKEVWLFENQEIEGDSLSLDSITVIPGRLTDFEMLTMADIDLEGIARTVTRMSRKPDAGILYSGETYIVPMLYSGVATVTNVANVGGVQIGSASRLLNGRAIYQSGMVLSGGTDGKIVASSSHLSDITGYYRTNTRGVHFLRFINGFGAVENISVRSKDKLSYEVSGETHSLVQEASVRPSDRRYATKSQPVGVYELSSGYVPQRWAEWYVQELLTSPRVWIQLGGKWVPALIEAEDDCVIYDRAKPEMPHVDFTLRLAIDGVTGVTW